MANIVTGEQYYELDGQLAEIKRQLRQQSGYPFSLDGLRVALQDVIEGHFASKSWREEDGVIYFSVTSDGATGEDWIIRLENKGFCIGDNAKVMLLSKDFKPSNGVTTEVAILRGRIFEDHSRTTKKICADANKRKFGKPNAELACLIREKFTDKDIEAMGLIRIGAMHKPIKNVAGFLYVGRRGDGSWLYVCYDNPGSGWYREAGLAFVVSQAVTF